MIQMAILNRHYNRILDTLLFFGFLGIGVALAYGPLADSTRFISSLIYGTDQRFIGWLFFIFPSIVYLLPGNWIFKLIALAPLIFILSAIAWFLFITPNRSWYVIPIFVVSLSWMALHYLRLVLFEHNA